MSTKEKVSFMKKMSFAQNEITFSAKLLVLIIWFFFFLNKKYLILQHTPAEVVLIPYVIAY